MAAIKERKLAKHTSVQCKEVIFHTVQLWPSFLDWSLLSYLFLLCLRYLLNKETYAYKLSFALELSTVKRMCNFVAAGFLFFYMRKMLFSLEIRFVTLQPWVTFFLFWSWSICLFTLCAHCSRLCYLDTILTCFMKRYRYNVCT